MESTPFLTKTYDIVEDSSTDLIVSWSAGNNSFIVKDVHSFSLNLLPRYFKHSNFSSFIRQLNTYGFRKVDADRWEFAHEKFLRGQKQLLKDIHRRRSHGIAGTSNSHAGSELATLKGEVERLKEEENAIGEELVQLKEEQNKTDREIEVMNRRLNVIERVPQQMISFLARLIDNPGFVTQMVQNRQLRGGKKRRRLTHKALEENLQPALGVNGLETNALIADGFTDCGLTRNELLGDNFVANEYCVSGIDSQIRVPLLSADLMPINQQLDTCIQKSEFKMDVGIEDDDLGETNFNDIMLWDDVFVEEAQFSDFYIESEMNQIAKSSDSN